MNKENIIKLLEEVNSIKDQGFVAMIKFDGERSKDKITGVIADPRNTNHEVIQFHGDQLEDVLEKLVRKFNSNPH